VSREVPLAPVLLHDRRNGFAEARMQAGLSHNGGPPLEEEDVNASWRHYLWRKAHKKAWKTPPPEIALRRLARAEELGMTYREYTLEIMERGRYL